MTDKELKDQTDKARGLLNQVSTIITLLQKEGCHFNLGVLKYDDANSRIIDLFDLSGFSISGQKKMDL